MSNKLDKDVREISAFRDLRDMIDSIEAGYRPTIRPESAAHKRVRKALARRGYSIYPEAMVKIAGLTGTQVDRIDDQLYRMKDGADRDLLRLVKATTLTRTTVAMPEEMAEILVEAFDEEKEDSAEMAMSGDAITDQEQEFAYRSVIRSYEALIAKIQKALRGTRI